jgi:hypothetical protein
MVQTLLGIRRNWPVAKRAYRIGHLPTTHPGQPQQSTLHHGHFGHIRR